LGQISPWPIGYLYTYPGRYPNSTGNSFSHQRYGLYPWARATEARQEASQQLEEALGEAVPIDFWRFLRHVSWADLWHVLWDFYGIFMGLFMGLLYFYGI